MTDSSQPPSTSSQEPTLESMLHRVASIERSLTQLPMDTGQPNDCEGPTHIGIDVLDPATERSDHRMPHSETDEATRTNIADASPRSTANQGIRLNQKHGTAPTSDTRIRKPARVSNTLGSNEECESAESSRTTAAYERADGRGKEISGPADPTASAIRRNGFWTREWEGRPAGWSRMKGSHGFRTKRARIAKSANFANQLVIPPVQSPSDASPKPESSNVLGDQKTSTSVGSTSASLEPMTTSSNRNRPAAETPASRLLQSAINDIRDQAKCNNSNADSDKQSSGRQYRHCIPTRTNDSHSYAKSDERMDDVANCETSTANDKGSKGQPERRPHGMQTLVFSESSAPFHHVNPGVIHSTQGVRRSGQRSMARETHTAMPLAQAEVQKSDSQVNKDGNYGSDEKAAVARGGKRSKARPRKAKNLAREGDGSRTKGRPEDGPGAVQTGEVQVGHLTRIDECEWRGKLKHKKRKKGGRKQRSEEITAIGESGPQFPNLNSPFPPHLQSSPTTNLPHNPSSLRQPANTDTNKTTRQALPGPNPTSQHLLAQESDTIGSNISPPHHAIVRLILNANRSKLWDYSSAIPRSTSRRS